MSQSPSPLLTPSRFRSTQRVNLFALKARFKTWFAAVLVGALGLSAAGLQAQSTVIWDGGGSPTHTWSTNANWTTSAPTSHTGTVVTLGLGSATTPNQNIANPFLLSQLNIVGTGTTALSGSALEFTANNDGAHYHINSTGTVGAATIANEIRVSEIGGGLDRFQVRSGSGGLTLNGNIFLHSGVTSIFRGNNAIRVNGQITNQSGGSTSFSVTDGVTLTLNNSANLINTLLMNYGTLVLGGNSGLGTVSNLSLGQSDANNARFNMNGFSQTVGGLSFVASTGAGTRIISNADANATSTLTYNRASGDQSFAGVIGDTGANDIIFIKQGANTLTLTGANTYTGGTTISAGTLQIGDGGTTGSISGNITNNAALVFNRSADLTYNGNLSGNGTVTKLGAGILGLSGNNSGFSGNVVLNSASIISLANANAGSAAAAFDLALSGGQLITSTTGYTINLGSLTGIAGTTLRAGGAAAGTGMFSIGALNTSTEFAGNIQNGTTGVFTAITKVGSGTLTLTGTASHASGTTVSAGTLQIGNGGTTGSISGDITNNAALTFNRSNALSYSGAVSGSGTLTKLGAGTLTLGGVNSFTGVTTLTGGTLSVATIGNGGIAGNLGQASNAASNLVFNGGTLQYTGATASSNRAFTINNGVTAIVDVSANTLTIAGATGAATTGGLTKTGAGSLEFSAANTYTGTTLVSGGTLILSGSGSIAGSTTVDVASGATLSTSGITFGTGQTVKGKGTIIGDAILQGTLAAGNSPGILTFNDDLTLASSTNSIFEIENTGMVRGTDYDGVNVLGMLTYDGTLTLTMTSLISDGTYNLFDFTTITGDFDTVVFDGGIYAGTFTQSGEFWTATDTNGSGQTFSFELASGDLSVIPEPSTTLLFTGALMAAVLFRRRRSI